MYYYVYSRRKYVYLNAKAQSLAAQTCRLYYWVVDASTVKPKGKYGKFIRHSICIRTQFFQLYVIVLDVCWLRQFSEKPK